MSPDPASRQRRHPAAHSGLERDSAAAAGTFEQFTRRSPMWPLGATSLGGFHQSGTVSLRAGVPGCVQGIQPRRRSEMGAQLPLDSTGGLLGDGGSGLRHRCQWRGLAGAGKPSRSGDARSESSRRGCRVRPERASHASGAGEQNQQSGRFGARLRREFIAGYAAGYPGTSAQEAVVGIWSGAKVFKTSLGCSYNPAARKYFKHHRQGLLPMPAMRRGHPSHYGSNTTRASRGTPSRSSRTRGLRVEWRAPLPSAVVQATQRSRSSLR